MRSKFLALVVALTGCSSPSPSEFARALSSDANLALTVANAHPEHECGGYLVQKSESFRAIPVRNRYRALLRFVDEFESGDMRNRQEYFRLLRHARPVHVDNGNDSIVAAIDHALGYESLSEFSPSICSILRGIADQKVLGYTYAPEYRVSDAVLRWHTHPHGSGPSRYDYENSQRPFGVLYERDGQALFHVVGDDAEVVVSLSYARPDP